MAYAEVPDLKARTGRLSSAWTDSSLPAIGDLERFLDDAGNLIDAVLSRWSVALPVPDPVATALRPLNAKLAALDALQATFPSANGPNEARALIDALKTELYGSDGKSGDWGEFMAGTYPAVVQLIQSGQITEASSFWTEEPDYGRYPFTPDDLLALNPQMLPYFSRLSRF